MFQSFDTELKNYDNSSEAQVHNFKQMACLCCFAQNVTFIQLKTCKHAGFLDFYFNYKVNYFPKYIERFFKCMYSV